MEVIAAKSVCRLIQHFITCDQSIGHSITSVKQAYAESQLENIPRWSKNILRGGKNILN